MGTFNDPCVGKYSIHGHFIWDGLIAASTPLTLSGTSAAGSWRSFCIGYLIGFGTTLVFIIWWLSEDGDFTS